MSSLTARPARLFRALAAAEMVTWTLLLLGMLGKYVLDVGDLGVRLGGGIHGFVFLAYCLVTVMIAVDQRWRLRDAIVGLASAVIPYATVPFERSAERRGLLGQSWRLRSDHSRAPQEKVVAAAVRNPVLAAAVSLMVVTVVFGGLLFLGPPWQWVQ